MAQSLTKHVHCRSLSEHLAGFRKRHRQLFTKSSIHHPRFPLEFTRHMQDCICLIPAKTAMEQHGQAGTFPGWQSFLVCNYNRSDEESKCNHNESQRQSQPAPLHMNIGLCNVSRAWRQRTITIGAEALNSLDYVSKGSDRRSCDMCAF